MQATRNNQSTRQGRPLGTTNQGRNELTVTKPTPATPASLASIAGSENSRAFFPSRTLLGKLACVSMNRASARPRFP